jgi:hypothetical protein
MYPQRELTRLAGHKAALRRHIAVHRAQCVVAAAQVARPLAWLDRAWSFWKRFSPLAQIAAVPLGFFARRSAFSRLKTLAALARWGPLVLGAVRGIGAAFKSRAESAD